MSVCFIVVPVELSDLRKTYAKRMLGKNSSTHAHNVKVKFHEIMPKASLQASV